MAAVTWLLRTSTTAAATKAAAAAAATTFQRRAVAGDDKERLVCGACGFIDYRNPKIVVGAVCVEKTTGRLLLCRRAIQPRYGSWTIPGGFLEEGESATDGAARETLEESGAEIAVGPLLAVYSIPRISQVHMWFRADVTRIAGKFGSESLEVKMFDVKNIPFDNISFPSIEMALRYWIDHANDVTVDVQSITRMPKM